MSLSVGKRLAPAAKRAVRATSLLDAPVERVIAHGRLLLCVLSVVYVAVASTTTAAFAVVGPVILFGYTVYAVALALLTRRRRPGRRTQLGIHAIDVAITTVGMASIGVSASLDLAFMTFVLLAATLRWNWYGVVATAAVLALLIGSGVRIPGEGVLEAPILQSLYLGTAGAMLAYVAAYLEYGRKLLAMLAEWPATDLPIHHAPVLKRTLAHAEKVLGAARILVVWEEEDEPDANLVLFSSAGYRHSSELAHGSKDLVEPTLSRAVFASEDITSNVVLRLGDPIRVKAPVIDVEFKDRFAITSFATAPLAGKFCHGRLFLLDRETWNDNHLLLTEIVAARLITELERQLLQIRAEQSAVARERIRVHRDLHDGLLQSLAAVGFQIRALTENPAEDVKARLDIIKDVLAKEQARIRDAIERSGGGGQSRWRSLSHESVMLSGRSHELLSQAARRWNCATSVEINPIDATVPRNLMEQLSFIFDEAIANAARHGRASRIEVGMQKADGRLRISIRDDGRGFFAESHSGGQRIGLVASAVTPASLRDRVCELGGTLSARGSENGVELQIELEVP